LCYEARDARARLGLRLHDLLSWLGRIRRMSHVWALRTPTMLYIENKRLDDLLKVELIHGSGSSLHECNESSTSLAYLLKFDVCELHRLTMVFADRLLIVYRRTMKGLSFHDSHG